MISSLFPKSLSCLYMDETQFCHQLVLWSATKLHPLYSLFIPYSATRRQSFSFLLAPFCLLAPLLPQLTINKGMKANAASNDKLTNRWQHRCRLGTSCCQILIVFCFYFGYLFLFYFYLFLSSITHLKQNKQNSTKKLSQLLK